MCRVYLGGSSLAVGTHECHYPNEESFLKRQGVMADKELQEG